LAGTGSADAPPTPIGAVAKQAYWRYRYAPHGVSLWIVAQQSGDPRHQVWIGVVERGPRLLNL